MASHRLVWPEKSGRVTSNELIDSDSRSFLDQILDVVRPVPSLQSNRTFKNGKFGTLKSYKKHKSLRFHLFLHLGGLQMT